MMVLVQKIAAQAGTKVMIGQMRRQLPGHILALRRQPAREPVARVMRPDHQILDDDVPIAFEARALRNPSLRLNDLFIVNHQISRLAALVGAGAALILFRATIGRLRGLRPLIHLAGLELRALLAAFGQNELLYPYGLLDAATQRFDMGFQWLPRSRQIRAGRRYDARI